MAPRRMVVLVTMLVACGIDESGLLPAGDASPSDATVDGMHPEAGNDVVIDVPMSCTTLDISACVDSGIPDGWAAVVTNDAGLCPTTADYTPSTYADNLGASGPCTCGCTASGTFSCNGTLAWDNDPSCAFPSSTGIIDGGPGCYAGNGYDFSIKGLTWAAAGTPKCVADASVTATATSSPVMACAPKCTADYCHVSGSFNRCIWSATATTCPPPFVNQDTVGLASDTTVSCGCTCAAVKQGFCTAGLSLFAATDSTCSTTPFLDASVTAGGMTCKNTGSTQVGSFRFQPNPPPTAGCTADGGTTPSVTFGPSQMTVCCLP